MTSSSGIFSTGEKKCMPSTRSGRAAPCAIWAIGIVEVLVAMIVSGRTSCSTAASTARFTARSSNTASMTRSVREKPLKSVVPESSAVSR